MHLLMLGCPGVGKGTQSKLLSEFFNIPHIAPGNILRDLVKKKTKTGKLAEKYIEKGELVPDDILVYIIQDVIHNSNGFILDGYPRNKQQIKFFFEIMRQESRQLTKVILLVADDDIIVERMLKRGRADDTKEVIKNRIEIYKKETLPILEMFPYSKIAIVESVGEEKSIHEEIKSLL